MFQMGKIYLFRSPVKLAPHGRSAGLPRSVSLGMGGANGAGADVMDHGDQPDDIPSLWFTS